MYHLKLLSQEINQHLYNYRNILSSLEESEKLIKFHHQINNYNLAPTNVAKI